LTKSKNKKEEKEELNLHSKLADDMHRRIWCFILLKKQVYQVWGTKPPGLLWGTTPTMKREVVKP